jgi:acyl carrier protein
MIPAAIVVASELPRTPSGKIDRQALAGSAAAAARGTAAAHVPPRTPVEAAVASIWASVLGVERVGVDEDFFALGGHSLLATQIVARIRSDFAIEMPLHSVFIHLTVASLAAEVTRLMESADGAIVELACTLEGLSDEEARELLLSESELGAPRGSR